MENKNSSEFKTSLNIIGTALKSSLKKHKVLWGIGIALVVIIMLVAIMGIVLTQTNFTFSLVNKVIPESIHTDAVEELDMDFYKEINPEYENSDTKVDGNNYIEIYNYYYLDENGEKQYLTNGEYHYTDANGEDQVIYVGIGFLYAAGEKIVKIKDAFNIIKWIPLVVLIVFLIVVWYIKDKERNQKNKPKRIRKAENKNQ